MKKFLLTALILISSLSLNAAVDFLVLDPCSGKELLRRSVKASFESVGSMSESVLEREASDFIGSELGVNTMYGTPIGNEALEIISRSQMRSYGWCYSVNGLSPEVYPSEFPLDDSVRSIVWYFGFAYYDSGVWLSQCEELFKNPHPFICSNL